MRSWRERMAASIEALGVLADRGHGRDRALGLGFDAVRVAMVELVRDFASASAGAQAEEVIPRWIVANQLEPAALAADWQRIAARVAPAASCLSLIHI